MWGTKQHRLNDIPKHLKTLESGTGPEAVAAAQILYEMCDVAHKHNRVTMVCSDKWDCLTPLSICLTDKSPEIRHIACGTLNNLAIPMENKRVMAVGPASKAVIGALCQVISQEMKETHLCCICLMNISTWEPSTTTILKYSPVPEGSEPIHPLRNPESLLRVLERLLINSPRDTSAPSFKSEGVRWACALLKSLTKSQEVASLIGKTAIPDCLVENIRTATLPPAQWAPNSLEDSSLFEIMQLAQWSRISMEALNNVDTINVIQPIMVEGNNVQGLKATMTCAFLGAPWTAFPDGGNLAAKNVSELITNIIEKKGKDGQYAHGIFKLSTGCKAYRDLAVAAAEADHTTVGSSSSTESHTKVLANPWAVSLCFRIVSDLVDAAMEDSPGYIPHSLSAEYAVGAIEAMLPAILEESVVQEQKLYPKMAKAANEFSRMLRAFASISGTCAEAQTSARNAAERLEGTSSTSKPILEISYDLFSADGF